jgi:hypothetical protein
LGSSPTWFHPIATYKDGAWIAGGRFDGTYPPGFDKPVPSLDEFKEYWAELSEQKFYGVYDRSIVFNGHGVKYATGFGYPDMLLVVCRGDFSGSASEPIPDFDDEYILMWNSASAWKTPTSISDSAESDRIKVLAQQALEGSLAKESWVPAERKAGEIDEALRFDLDAETKAVWIHVTAEYAEAPDKSDQQDSGRLWIGHHYAILKEPISEADAKPLWQHTVISDEDGKNGTFYTFLGAGDVNGDGTAEVVLREHAWETWVYYLYALEKESFVKATAAGYSPGP